MHQFLQLGYLVGFIMGIYHDARSYERQIQQILINV
jgi:hypothetical protein